jgi:D-arabinose 1-dehydrogenase-like Zn-dependent alcohol dehydrogenase
MELATFPLTQLEPDALWVKVGLANVCGSDLHAWRGELKLRPAPPVILGHEMVGRVHELGERVHTDSAGAPLCVGDRVVFRYFIPCRECRSCRHGRDAACATAVSNVFRSAAEPPHFLGGYADYYHVMRHQSVFRVPDDVPDDLAATANCALAEVIYGLHRVRFHPGASLAIQGAGGLGLFMTAVARGMEASRIVVIDRNADRLEMARAFGADDVINAGEVPEARDRIRLVKAQTDGGADVVAELVGSPQVVPEGIAMLANGGTYLEIGNISTGLTYQADPALLVLTSKSIVGVILFEAWALREALAFLSRTQTRFPFQRLVSQRYPLAEIDQAFRDADQGRVPRAAIDLTGR